MAKIYLVNEIWETFFKDTQKATRETIMFTTAYKSKARAIKCMTDESVRVWEHKGRFKTEGIKPKYLKETMETYNGKIGYIVVDCMLTESQIEEGASLSFRIWELSELELN